MKYVMLLAYDEAIEPQWGTPEGERYYGMFADYGNELNAAGVIVGGEPLQPLATATTLRLQGGELVTTDGPFAETREQIGGFYVLECADLDEALAWAAKCPIVAGGYGAVEVRPVLNIGG